MESINEKIKKNEYIKTLLNIEPDKRDEKILLELMSFTKNFKLFETISMTNEHAFICKSMEVENFRPNEVIVKQGDKGDSFYYILSGIVKIVICKKYDLGPEEGEISIDKYIGDLKAGQSFGELSLIYGTERSATIISVTNSTLIKINKLSFDTYVKDIFETQLKDQIDFMKICPIFHKIEKEKLIKLAIRSEIKKFIANKDIFNPNQLVDFVYIIRRGSIKVYKKVKFIANVNSIRNELLDQVKNDNSLKRPEQRQLAREKAEDKLSAIIVNGPSKDDIDNFNYVEKEVLVETLRIGDIFPSYYSVNGIKLDVKFTTETPCELILIKIHDLIDMLYESYQFIKNYAKPYPEDHFLRKYQNYKSMWDNYKKQVVSNIRCEIENKTS